MSTLFDQTTLNGMTLKNRFFRSATWEGLAGEDGSCTPRLIEMMERLAEGGVGAIITGHAYVEKLGQASPWQLGVHEDHLVDGLKHMVDAVHGRGGKIILQLAHAGIFSRYSPEPTGPSSVDGFSKHPIHVMTVDDIRTVVEAFGQASARARSAGFDGVQIHAAHGYLVNQFLSPVFNRRADAYGGAVENRSRLLVEIFERIRKEVGAGYPVLIKINCRDFLDHGLSGEDSLRICRVLQDEGLDAVELSGGTLVSGKLGPARSDVKPLDHEAYFSEYAKQFKSTLKLPVILVGGIRSVEISERIVSGGIADYVSMSRPFIREPGLINRWKSGDRCPAACLSDSKCFSPALKGEGLYCVIEKREPHGKRHRP